MSKELKKKPGDMQKARRRHLQQQARRDALSKLRQEDTNTMWAHYNNGSSLVVVYAVEPSVDDYVLCLVNKRLKVMHFYFRQNNGICLTNNYHRVVIPSKQIFGVVSRFLDFHWKCPDCIVVRKLLDKPELVEEFTSHYGKKHNYVYDMSCRQCAMNCEIVLPNRVDE